MYRKTIPLIMFLNLLCLCKSQAQQTYFNKLYKNKLYDMFSVIPVEDGYVLGAADHDISDFDKNYFSITKTNIIGEVQWQQVYEYSEAIYGKLISTPDSGFLFMNNKCDSLDDTLLVGYLMKMNSLGEKEWEKEYKIPEGIFFHDCVLNKNKSAYAISGSRKLPNDEAMNHILLIDLQGIILGETSAFAYVGTTPESIINTSDSSYLISGDMKLAPNQLPQIFVSKFKKDLSLNWQLWLGDFYWERSYDIMETSDSNYVICGSYAVNGDNVLQMFNYAYIVKISKDGELMWEKKYGPVLLEKKLNKIIELPDGSLVASGLTGFRKLDPDGAFSNGSDMASWILKVSSQGDSLWSQTFKRLDQGLNSNAFFSDMAYTAIDKGFILSGSISPGLGDEGGTGDSYNGWLVKVDSMGCDNAQCIPYGIQNTNKKLQSINIYPNPFSEIIQIRSEKPLTNTKVIIYNLLGEIIYNKKMDSLENVSINLSQKKNGIYLVSIYTNDETVFHQRIIKN